MAAKPSKNTAPKRDVYADVTSTMIALMKKGVAPWRQGWNGTKGVGHKLPIRFNGQSYNGMNVVLLWAAAQEKGYDERRWMTFKQAQKLGGMVRKGEKGTLIIKAGRVVKDVEDPKDANKTKTIAIPFIKGYTVFNICQIDGLPETLFEATKIEGASTVAADQRITAADLFFEKIPATVKHGGDKAFYSPTQDFIQLPEFTDFHTAQNYYATRGHETIHWTRHESRLDRSFSQKRFGDAGYAMEELVAELGAAFLCAELEIDPEEQRADHAAYLAHWIKVLEGDNKAIFTAASFAQKACDYLYEVSGRNVAVAGDDDDGEVSEAAMSRAA